MFLLNLIEHFVESKAIPCVCDKEVWIWPRALNHLDGSDQILYALKLKAVEPILILCIFLSSDGDLEQEERVATRD